MDRLLVENGRVVGVAVGADELRAGAVVIATGGFGANPELLAEHYPSAWDPEQTWYIGHDGARGDALALGAQVEAQVTGADRGLRTLNPGFGKMNEALMPGWTVILDPSGRRFANETAPYGLMDNLVRARGNHAWVVFDDAALRPPAELEDAYTHAYKEEWPNHATFRTKNYNADVVDKMVEQGRIHHADTLEGLATAMGVDPVLLVGEITRYNRHCEHGTDLDFDKPGRFLLPLRTAPFYAAHVTPTTVAVTAAGLRVDAHARVIAADGTVIDGLFAAGECVGGVIGVYMGSGNGLGSAGTVGRIAGGSAAHALLAQGA